MRCLGRLVSLGILAILIAGIWLYRDDLRRRIDHALHPAAVATHLGHPSPEALRRAMARVDALQRTREDSVIITADEMASLLAQGADFLPGVTFDSLSVELGDRSVRIRTVIDSARIPASFRELIPGGARHYEEIRADGDLAPVHAGLAELDVQHVSVRGIPLPGALIRRVTDRLRGQPSPDARLEITLPPAVGGFRVHPDGVTIYRQGASR